MAGRRDRGPFLTVMAVLLGLLSLSNFTKALQHVRDPLATPVIVQLQRSDSPLCWTASYADPDRNDTREFRSTAD